MKNIGRCCWLGLGVLLFGAILILLLHCLRPSSNARHPEIPPDSFHRLKNVLSRGVITVRMEPVGGGLELGIRPADLSGQEAKAFCVFLERHLDAALASYPVRAKTEANKGFADEPFAQIMIESESSKASILVFHNMYTPETRRSNVCIALYRVKCPGLTKMVMAGLAVPPSDSSATNRDN